MNKFFTLEAFGQYGWATLEADLRLKKNPSCCIYDEALNKSHVVYQWNTLIKIDFKIICCHGSVIHK